MPDSQRLWAPRAWLPDGWHDRVLLAIGADGHWSDVVSNVAPPANATVLSGAALPGLINAHSHAFQRAFAGFAERSESSTDNFWSWRDRMYRVALRITPEQLEAIAAQLYVELLRGGYTQVCEFHYLQHDPQGTPYADPLRLSWALADAAQSAGLGLTMLPVLYERAGFNQSNLRTDQRRFSSTPSSVWAAREALHHSGRTLLNAGVAIHSLRAASPSSIATLRNLASGMDDSPIHIHVSEQMQEVEDCIATLGARPVEWLAREGLLDQRWQLVHTTHTATSEIDSVARSGAGVVICPSTEANLGDGLCDLSSWLASGASMSIGSDSHITRDWREELRLLEYGQRLIKQQRNISASPQSGMPSTAERLWSCVQSGGAAAAGFKHWGITLGARADLLVMDAHDANLLGVPDAHSLDALVFSSPASPWRDVMVAGQWIVRRHHHAGAEKIATQFVEAMHSLWAHEMNRKV
jgi:formimidoylglutamate deiminase